MGNEHQGMEQAPLNRPSRLREAELTDSESLAPSVYE